MNNSFAVLAAVTRGEIVESTHLGDLVIADAEGQIRFSTGDPTRFAYFRSSQKPLQALAVVQSGAADRFHFTQTELSVCCASHSGSQMHVETVRGILNKLGLDETALACGTHEPGDLRERQRLIRERQDPSPLHNNCSGKHTGMLATAVALGAPVEGYLDRGHPVQKLITRNMAAMTSLPESSFKFGIDGCGAPVIAAPLQSMARAYARLANPAAGDELAEPCRRVMEAMAAAPEMVASPGSFNTELLDAGGGNMVAKGGAEGAFLIGLRDPRRLGIALKIADGSSRAIPPVAIAALRHVGGLSESALGQLQRFISPAITNCHGTVVGNIEAAFELEAKS